MKLSAPTRLQALAAAAVLLVLIGLWLLLGRDSGEVRERARADRPNIVVIQTDDQYRGTVKGDFRDRSGRRQPIMPNTVRGIFERGTEFTDYYASTPVCSPSRASLLTGQYSANNGLLRNNGPRGGWSGWQQLPTWRHNVPLTLQRAGYRTAHIGKLMNGNWDAANGGVDLTVPPGWDRWFTVAYLEGAEYYGYRVNDDGRAIGPFGVSNYTLGTPALPRFGVDSPACRAVTPRTPAGDVCNYQTDVTTRKAVREIRRNANRPGRPFYLQVDYQAPHRDDRPPTGPAPPTRYAGSAGRTPFVRNPATDEADVSDKPPVIRRAIEQPLTPARERELLQSYRAYVETVRGIDDGVGAILKTVAETGQLDNTYIFFFSDQGEFLGEHRFLKGKFLAYEASSRVAMAVRGPGIRAGAASGEVVGNIDVPATVLDLAGARPDYRVDGRSLEPFWQDPERRTRRPFQISYFGGRDRTGASGVSAGGEPSPRPAGTGNSGRRTSSRAPAVPYRGFRVGPYKYVRYASGAEELYYLDDDPFELENRIDDPEFRDAAAYMRRHLKRAGDCQGRSCSTELPPWPDPDR